MQSPLSYINLETKSGTSQHEISWDYGTSGSNVVRPLSTGCKYIIKY